MAFSWLIRGGYQLLTIPGMILRVVDHLKKNNKKTSGFHEVDSFFLRFWESFHHPKCWVSIIISIVLDFHCPYWYNFGKPFGFKKKQWPVKNQKNPMGGIFIVYWYTPRDDCIFYRYMNGGLLRYFFSKSTPWVQKFRIRVTGCHR